LGEDFDGVRLLYPKKQQKRVPVCMYPWRDAVGVSEADTEFSGRTFGKCKQINANGWSGTAARRQR
jgi:hypothetical protein